MRMPWRHAVLFACIGACATAHAGTSRLLDGFDDAAAWQVAHSDDVSASSHENHGALCVDFDFNGVSGYVSLRRALPMAWKGNFALSFRVRGESPPNALQMKLIDASGDNVWWYNRPDFRFGRDWQTVRAERRQIGFAWGPAADHSLRRTAAVELAIAAGKGGRGQVCFDELRLQALPPPRTAWPAPVAQASSALPGQGAAQALDGDPGTAWRSDPARGAAQALTLDFGAPRPLGGVVLHWQGRRFASRYDVQASGDGHAWTTLRRVVDGNGGDDPLLLADTHARYLRLALRAGPGKGYALAAIDVEDLAWGATPNGFFERLARGVRRGLYPRGFSGEQSYWTLVGVDGGGAHAALLSEDGALEVGKGGFSLEPLLLVDGKLLDWADVRIDHALADGYLPMPSATWRAGDLSLRTEAFASGDRTQSRAFVRYTVGNADDRARDVTLALALRPFQVNPPTQFLNSPGGVSPIHALAWSGAAVAVNGTPRLFPLQAPDRFVASSFDAGNVVARLAAGDVPRAGMAHDAFGYASGAMLFHLHVPAHGRRSIELLAPLNGAFTLPGGARQQPAAWFDRQRAAVAAHWHGLLDRVEVRGPPAAQTLVDTARSSLAWILIS
ncbi:MAG TPA: discoidin domain-containing protein, partial [Rhodanobacteraceae bacterium]|nr:discoidin domain-containing protein [Rhodanobacteraceae bacterium]